nr:hypothetical protein 31 [bacterium]
MKETNTNDKIVVLTKKQAKAWQYLTDPYERVVLYGGAKGGGKSFFLCLWVAFWMDYLIDYFAITKKDFPHPPSLGFLGRKQAVDLKETTLETWKKNIPAKSYTINENKKEILWKGLAKFSYGGLDKCETINKFNSAEYCFFAIDQAEETAIEDIGVLRGSLRAKYRGKTPPYKELFTANPAECWLKNEFDLTDEEKEKKDNEEVNQEFKEKHIFVPALPSDNPHLPDSYVQRLKEAFKYDDNLLRAYLYGDWNMLSGFKKLLSLNDVKQCFKNENNSLVRNYEYKIISADLARFGDDKTVIGGWVNEELKEKIIYGKKDMEYTYGVLRDLDDRMGGGCLFVLDASDPFGGGGLVDRLNKSAPKRVLGVNNSERANRPDLFYNRRAELYAYARDIVKKGQCRIDAEDIELHQEMCAIEYDYTKVGNLLKFPDKEEIKKKLKRSPNSWDMFILGLWGIGWLKSNEGKEKFEFKKEPEKVFWNKEQDFFGGNFSDKGLYV